jgi:hypothetical protein
MSADRDVTRIVRSWLEEGRTALPDRVLDAVLDQLPATPQRRAGWPARRLQEMNSFAKFALAAAIVVVVALVGINLLPRNGGVTSTGPGPTSSPAPSPSPTPAPSASGVANLNHVGNFDPGTTYFIDDPCCTGPSRISLTFPASGWFSIDPVILGKNVLGDPNRYDIYLSPHLVGNLYTGGCKWRGTALDPPVGPTVDDLATALVAQAGPGASPAASVTVGGHPGKKVELSIPEGLDVNTCDSDGDFAIFGRWYTGAMRDFGAAPWTYGDGQHNTVYIVDVDGTRQVIDTMYLPGTSAANLAELDQVIASIRFETLPPSPSPAT